MVDDYYRQYGLVLILSVVAVIIPTSMLLLSWLAQFVRIRPQKPSLVKSEIYECGMETIGGRWVQFNFRYYLYALFFLVFDVTAIFVYPWAIQLKTLGAFAYLEMLAFLLILAVGWVYAWRKGALEWK
jgi:NADH-quinone oxidoreductase subunit A